MLSPPWTRRLPVLVLVAVGGAPYGRAFEVVLSVLALYLVMWLVVGRDPPDPPVTVRYTPPEGFSAAALGYLHHRRYDDTQLTATVVSLAIQGVLRIEYDRVEWRLKATGVVPETLASEERRFAKRLFHESDTLVLGIDYTRVRKAMRALGRDLRLRLDKHYVVTNRGWFVAGLLASLGGLARLASGSRLNLEAGVWVWMAAWLLLMAAFGWQWVRFLPAWLRAVADGTSSWPENVVYVLAMALLAGILALIALWIDAPPDLLLAVLALGVLNVVFLRLLARPTVAGRRLLNHIEGFRLFLSATDGGQVNRLQPAGAHPTRFEPFLPYAIALDLGGTWAALLEAGLRSWGTEDQWERHRNDRISRSYP